MNARIRWRLGADLGTNSLGWAVIELNAKNEPIGLVAAGSRIFSDGREAKSGASLAVARRAARAMRRRRDRFKQRQEALLKHLTLAGLFPGDATERAALAGVDPFELRARALHEPLPPHQIGRALFHLNQRRGFKSNRKVDRGKNDEDGKVRLGVSRLYEAMRDRGAATLGEFLHSRRAGATDANAIPGVRTRLRPETGEGGKGDGYDFYPDRQMLEEEFDAIWTAQRRHHPGVLTAEARKRLFEVIFHQRPLRAPKIGRCMLIASEDRLAKAHPLFQQRRLLEELNALKIAQPGEVARALSVEQRDLLYGTLKSRRALPFETMRKALKLAPEARFNKESENRKDIKGDEVAAELGSKSRFGKRWQHLDADRQWNVVSRIRDVQSEADEAALLDWLREQHGLSAEQGRATINARLPEGYGRFGVTATRKLIEALRADVVVYSEAVKTAGFHHSDFRSGELWDELPYYGAVLERHIMPGTGAPSDPEELRIGRLTNPTVHIGLNQLRRVVNQLIKRYGRPEQIAIELARELKLNDERKREINNRNRENREAAEKRSQKLSAIGIADKGGNRALLKLWEELNPDNVLDRRCIYTGTQISIEMLFSGAVEVDHILPFSATWDDSNDNRLLCTREANREKRKRSPHEAFSKDGARWEEIAARASRLPRGKRWRFEPDAMARFDNEGGFLARQLVDTQYLSRLAREYLGALYPEQGEGSGHVWASPGRLTEMLRRSWGLNSLLPDHNFAGGADQPKNRRDHRHHAIDAVVVGVTDRHLLQRIAHESGQRGHEAANRVTADLPEPWGEFRASVDAVIKRIVVSHRADHGSIGGRDGRRSETAGRLHNDTAYGLTGEKDEKGNDLVVHRVPLSSLSKADDLKRVRDKDLRNALLDWTKEAEPRAFATRLLEFPRLGPLPFRGVRRLRIQEPLSVIPIHDANGRAYKGYKGDSNYRYDVWELKGGRWVAEVVSMFDAHQRGRESAIRRDNPTARKVLSLHQDDTLAIETAGHERKLVRVVKFGLNGQVTLAEHHEAGDLKRRDALANDIDPFKYSSPTPGGLKKLRARQVRIDELGRVYDPGPRDRDSTAE